MNLESKYRQIHRVQENDIKLLLLELGPRLSWSDDDVVAEVGCGYGTTTRDVLLPHCRKLTAIDSCSTAIEYAKKCSASSPVEYHVTDIEDRETFPVKWQERFTKVFSFHFLHWVSNQRKALENIYHLLAPGGECVLLFITWTDVWNMVNDMTIKKEWKKYLKGIVNRIPESQFCSSDERTEAFEEILKDIGFDVKTCDEIQASFIYNSDEDCRGVLELLCPNTVPSLSATRRHFIDTCLLELQRKKKTNKLKHHELCYSKMVIHAKKAIEQVV